MELSQKDWSRNFGNISSNVSACVYVCVRVWCVHDGVYVRVVCLYMCGVCLCGYVCVYVCAKVCVGGECKCVCVQ